MNILTICEYLGVRYNIYILLNIIKVYIIYL